MKLSIIIPVYNVEQYLERCLDSCLKQDLSVTDYEIIAVNDGSTDRSLDILNDYADKYTNIKIISQQNEKQGAARNKGLNSAKGEYIWFVDADDWIEENCLLKLCHDLKDSDIYCLYSNWNANNTSFELNERTYLNNWNFKARLNLSFEVMVHQYLFRRNYLLDAGIKFIENILIEDLEYIPRVLVQAKNIKIINYPIYYYFVRKDSTMHSINPFKCESILVVANSLLSFMNSRQDQKEQDFIRKYISSAFHLFLLEWKDLSKGDRLKSLSSLKKSKLFLSTMGDSNRLGTRLKVFLVYFSSIILLSVLKTEAYVHNKLQK